MPLGVTVPIVGTFIFGGTVAAYIVVDGLTKEYPLAFLA